MSSQRLVSAAAVCLFVILFEGSSSAPPSIAIDENAKPICVSPECIEAASLLISNLDKSTDPCDDFYQFSCGGWIQSNDIPETESDWGTSDSPRVGLRREIRDILEAKKNEDDPYPLQLAKDVYKDCMDLEELESVGTTPIIDLMMEFGGWPIIVDDWNSKAFNWQNMVSTLTKSMGASWIFSSGLSIDDKNTSRYVIVLSRPDFALDRSMLVSLDSFPTVVSAYKAYIVNIAVALAEDGNKKTVDVEKLKPEIDQIVEFEGELAKITAPPEDLRNASVLYNVFKLSELQNLTDPDVNSDSANIDWQSYFQEYFSVVKEFVQIGNHERIIVKEPDYFRKLSLLLSRTPIRTIANYLFWRLASDVAIFTNKRMRHIEFEYSKAITGVEEINPRWKTCTGLVNAKLGTAISKKFIHLHFNKDTKEKALMMTNEIQKAFQDILHGLTWMDNQTKFEADQKAKSMRINIAYPDWLWSNDSALDDYYRGLNVNATSHLQNFLEIILWEKADRMKKFREAPDMDEWVADPTVVNAYYSPKHNSITFPAGILRPPFYYQNTPAYLNFGAIGTTIGHEITHGFDDEGRQHDKDGNERQWWTQETLNAYTDKTKCFIDQYGKYKIKELVDIKAPNDTINGHTTQGENIADNGGLRQAYQAYMRYVEHNGAEPTLPGLSQYNPEQLFFMSFANPWCQKQTTANALLQLLSDPHSPNKFRIIGSVSNSEDFARVWNCQRGSKMNPDTKCVLW